MSRAKRKLQPEEKAAFVAEYSRLGVKNPWWASACDQYHAGDDKLLRGVRRKAMREACKKFKIPLRYGIEVVREFLAS